MMQTSSFNIPETLNALKSPSFVIEFALRELEAFEVEPFLRDYQAGHDLTDWLEGLNEDRAGIPQAA